MRHVRLTAVLLFGMLLAVGVAAAVFSEFDAHYEDGSSMQGVVGTKYGQECYYSLRVTCPSIDQPCEAAERMQQFVSAVPPCDFVQPPPHLERRGRIQPLHSSD